MLQDFENRMHDQIRKNQQVPKDRNHQNLQMSTIRIIIQRKRSQKIKHH